VKYCNILFQQVPNSSPTKISAEQKEERFLIRKWWM